MIPLHVHSFYSPLAAMNSPEEICAWASHHQLPGIALTDTNALYGMVHFRELAEKYNLIPLIGSEVLWGPFRVVILCSNIFGHQKLCLLLSSVHLKKICEKTFKEALLDMKDEVVLFTDDRELLQDLKGEYDQERLYFEFSPGFSRHRDKLWATEQGILCLGSTRARYIEKGDEFFIRLGQAIFQNKTLGQVDLSFFKETCRLLDPVESRNVFSLYPEMIKNTYRVFDLCRHIDWGEKKVIFPRFNKWSPEKCDEVLREKSFQGIEKKYSHELSSLFQSKLMKRLEYELGIICQKGFSSYFLVVEDIVRHCPRTCGRGSAASSLVSFLLGITHVDPLKYNLYFERFLNPEREDPPDIDIDFPWDERDRILDYVFRKYPGHSAMVSNHNSLQGASAIREVAKVYGVPFEEINDQIQSFPRVTPTGLWKKIFFQAKRLEGHFRHLSVHPGGVVITPRPISSYVPLEMAPKGVPLLQWEKRQVKKFGLVKIDLLGNRSLAVIRDTLNAVNGRFYQEGKKKITYENLDPVHDLKTKSLLQAGGTMGVFYIESPASRLLLQRMNSSHFEHIVMASSIIRPAANEYALEFVRRIHGKRYSHLHPCLAPILEESYGLMIYQEQVSQTAIALVGFTMSEGNELRKVLDKKDKRKKLQDFEKKFFEGGEKRGICFQTLDHVWKMILSFSGYSFCKAHSASYAMVSFKSSYLKSHYPAEFMSAVLSHGGGFYSLSAYLEEARRLNIKILVPDVNESDLSYQGHGGTLRVGLQQLHEVSDAFRGRMIESRKSGGYFSSLDDFLMRTRPSFEEAKILVKVRAFHSLRKGDSFCRQMWRVYEWFSAQKGGHIKGEMTSYDCKEFSPWQLIEWEMHFLKSAVSFPPWALYPKALKAKERVRSADLHYHVGQRVSIFGVYVTGKIVWTRKREEMCFVTFSDETGLIETVLFPQVHVVFRDLLFSGKAFSIKGKVERCFGVLQIQVEDVSVLKISLDGYVEKEKQLH